MPSLTPLKINNSKDPEDPTPAEICLSPSWSDHGEKKRKKERKRMEKEQKEIQKRLKQDQENQRAIDIKAGKRLSKNPPPAAMETQKMPQALRRSSWVSIISSRTSGEDTRRSSREEKRISGTSIDSLDSQSRSRSTPATSTEEAPDRERTSGQSHNIVSSAAPKIPNFGWSSRRTSSGTDKSVSWGSEDAYTREVISFAYRLEGSPIHSEHNKPLESKSRQNSTSPALQNAASPTFRRSVTESNIASAVQQPGPRSPQRPPAHRKDSSERRSKHWQNDAIKENGTLIHSPKASPNFQNDLAAEMEAIMASHHQKPLPNPPSPRSAQTRSSRDGSSYVHKQRMYQQQRSIAGFEDEQAVKDANDVTAKSDALVSEDAQQVGLGLKALDPREQLSSNTMSTSRNITRDRVPVSPMTQDSVVQPDTKPPPMKQQSPAKQQVDAAPSSSLKPAPPEIAQEGQEQMQARASSQSVRDSVSLNKTQSAPGMKTDKILSFRRRSKVAPSKIFVPANGQINTSALQSVPPPVAVTEKPSEKRSKVNPLLGESKVEQVYASGMRRSESSSRSQPGDSLLESKNIKSHARNRPISSTVLNETVPLQLSPKTTTEHFLMSDNKVATESENNGNGKELHLEAEPESPKDKHKSPVVTDKPLPEMPPAVNNTPTPTSTGSKGLTNTKHVPEVVVESTTEEGLVRKTSIKRPRSNPQLQTQTTATNPLPSLDFLPELKHQPLVKRQPQFLPVPKEPGRFPPVPTDYATIKSMATKSPASSNPPDLELIPRSPFRTPSQFPVPGRTFNRSATEVGSVSLNKGALAEGMEAKPIAKLFVICCKCKFWHDLPSKLYEAMALPKELHKDEEISGGKGKRKITGARLETAVKCPWCEHAMTTWCCQGWTTVVYLHERHH